MTDRHRRLLTLQNGEYMALTEWTPSPDPTRPRDPARSAYLQFSIGAHEWGSHHIFRSSVPEARAVREALTGWLAVHDPGPDALPGDASVLLRARQSAEAPGTVHSDRQLDQGSRPDLSVCLVRRSDLERLITLAEKASAP